MRVVKELTFDAAHMLSNYKGKCNNLHGHTYKVRIELVTPVANDMVIDFNEIKSFFNDRFDHAIVLAGDGARDRAENALYDWVTTWHKKYYVMPKDMRPTAENMALIVATYFKETYNTDHVGIQIWETPTSYAEEMV